ncbi:MAG: fibronectin type III domain-containing protein [Lachnospiraceae bacterium]|nr:fibronectin type III domain-containing protein [Lachnospiraceae bacterium]
MKNKKLFSLVVTTAMVITTAFGSFTNVAKADESKKDTITVYVAAEGENASGAAVSMDDVTKNPTGAAITSKIENAKKAQDLLAETIYNTTFEGGKKVPGIEDVNGLYVVFSLARAGFKADSFYDDVYEKISAQLCSLKMTGKVYDENSDKYITEKSIISDGYASQTYAKIALCVEALGKNPADVGGFNLIDKLVDRSVYDSSSIYSREDMILFALDAADAYIPEGDKYLTREELVNTITDDVDNQIETSISWGSIDSAAMAIQPLAPYVKKDVANVSKAAVTAACDKALRFIESMQGTDGIYGDSYSSSNVWTLAQVMTTAGLFGCDILSESDGSDFVKNGTTLFDVANSFVDIDSKKVNDGLMSFQPEQLLRGLNSCIRSLENRSSLYNTSDADYKASEPSKMAVTSDMISTVPDKYYTGKNITPSVTVKNDGIKLVKDKDYTVTYKNNKKIGTATVIITGKGNYILSCKTTFKIKMAKAVISKVKAGKKKAVIDIKKVPGAKKYRVEISTNKNFKPSKSVKVKNTSLNKVTFTGLKSGKKYYVRAMAYAGSDKGAYSKTVSVKVK